MKLEPSLLRSILSRHRGVRPGLGNDAFLLSTPVSQSVSLTVEVRFGHHGTHQVNQSLLIPNFDLNISREFVHAEVGNAVAEKLMNGRDDGRRPHDITSVDLGQRQVLMNCTDDFLRQSSTYYIANGDGSEHASGLE